MQDRSRGARGQPAWSLCLQGWPSRARGEFLRHCEQTEHRQPSSKRIQQAESSGTSPVSRAVAWLGLRRGWRCCCWHGWCSASPLVVPRRRHSPALWWHHSSFALKCSQSKGRPGTGRGADSPRAVLRLLEGLSTGAAPQAQQHQPLPHALTGSAGCCPATSLGPSSPLVQTPPWSHLMLIQLGTYFSSLSPLDSLISCPRPSLS